MKILDRYLLISVILPFLFCVTAFFSLWIIYQLFDNITDLIDAKASLWFIIKYYAVQFPNAAQLFLPIAFFFSCLYLLTYMSARRELIAVMSAGVSLARISVPFFLLSLVVAGTQYLLYIKLSPESKKNSIALENQLKRSKQSPDVFSSVVYKNPATGAMWYVARLDAEKGTVEQAEILTVDALGRDKQKLIIAKGTFKDNRYWDFYNVRKVDFARDGTPGKPVDIDQMDAYDLNETPESMISVLRPPEEFTWPDLHHFTHATYKPSANRMARYYTDYYYRMAYPLISPILCLFAISLGISHERRSSAASLMACLVILFSLLIFLNLSVALGNGKRIMPFAAAWNTILLFGSSGLILYAAKVGWIWELHGHLKPYIQQFMQRRQSPPSTDHLV